MEKTFSTVFGVIEDGLKNLDSFSIPNETAQLEIYFSNRITMQVFKSSDVKDWNLNLPFDFKQKFIIGVLFGDSLQGWLRLRRFRKFNDFKSFSVVHYKQDNFKVYFKELNDIHSVEENVTYIIELLSTVKLAKKQRNVNVMVKAYLKD